MALTNEGIAGGIAERIKKTIENNKLVHAYILEGDLCMEKLSFAKEFAKAILCTEKKGIGCDTCRICRKIDHDNHEDIHYVIPTDKGNIIDDAITSLQENLRRKPLSGEYNIAIITSADKMNVRAQNRLLKTLEEPIGKSVIILLSENTEVLLQTIRSRCVIYRLNDFSTFSENEYAEKAKEMIDILASRKPFYLVSEKISEIISDRRDAMKFLDALELSYRNLLFDMSPRGARYSREEIYKAVTLIEKAKAMLNVNVTVAYAIKGLMLELEDI